jgi:hypothetical protein
MKSCSFIKQDKGLVIPTSRVTFSSSQDALSVIDGDAIRSGGM